MGIEEFNEVLVKEIISSADETVPKTKGGKRGKNGTWCNDNCSKVVKDRYKAFRYLKRHHSNQALMEYKHP